MQRKQHLEIIIEVYVGLITQKALIFISLGQILQIYFYYVW